MLLAGTDFRFFPQNRKSCCVTVSLSGGVRSGCGSLGDYRERVGGQAWSGILTRESAPWLTGTACDFPRLVLDWSWPSRLWHDPAQCPE